MLNDDTHPRMQLELDEGWQFIRQARWRWQLAAGPPQSAEVVDLPHSWNTQDDFQDGVSYYRGPGIYWKTFHLPATVPRADVHWQLCAGGFYGTGDVWLNGHSLGQVDGQYLGFVLAATEHLRFGELNTLCIRLTNRCARHVLPGIRHPDFLLYGGLAGGLKLQAVPALHFADHPQIQCEDVLGPAPAVVVRFAVINQSAQQRRCTIRWEVAGAESTCELQLAPGETSAAMAVRLTPAQPRLWSLEQRQLYAVRGEVREAGRLVDALTTRTGLRQAEFRPDAGFFLNGQRVELRGVNRHENIPGFGLALPPALHREDARLIRELGLNFVRLSHYPQSPVFLEACDELGLLVYAELASWKSVRTGRWLKNAERQFRGMIRRDRHHPSLILWGMGNEAQSRQAFLRLRAVARELDPARPVTYAENHFYRAARERTLGLPDVWGCNYEFDALEQGRDAADRRCVVVSECSNYPPACRGALAEELRQVDNIEQDLARLADKPFVAGFALWSFADYGTLRKKRFYRCCGVVDAWRQPKPAAALMQARYATAPVLQVFGDWQAGGPAQRAIHLFTNCPEVRLVRNQILWQALPACAHLRLMVPFEAGELRVEGWRAGRLEAVGHLFTTGPAQGLAIRAVRALDDEWLTFLVCAVDAAGRIDGRWHGDVVLTADGAARLHTYQPGHVITLFGGTGVGFLSRRDGRPVVVRATAPGLVAAELTV
jgi:hypothetical protein